MAHHTCPSCGNSEAVKAIRPGGSPSDHGQLKCPICKSVWCKCRIHGNYECPPPCPVCTKDIKPKN
jgi:hypothetical protein